MTNQLFIKPEEGKFLAMAVLYTIELLHSQSQNDKINWNPETRRDLKKCWLREMPFALNW